MSRSCDSLCITVISHFTFSFLYVLAPNATEVQVLSIQKAGQGQNLNTLNIAGPTKAAGVTISELPMVRLTKPS